MNRKSLYLVVATLIVGLLGAGSGLAQTVFIPCEGGETCDSAQAYPFIVVIEGADQCGDCSFAPGPRQRLNRLSAISHIRVIEAYGQVPDNREHRTVLATPLELPGSSKPDLWRVVVEVAGELRFHFRDPSGNQGSPTGRSRTPRPSRRWPSPRTTAAIPPPMPDSGRCVPGRLRGGKA